MSETFSATESRVLAIWQDTYYFKKHAPEPLLETKRITGFVNRFRRQQLEKYENEITTLLQDLPPTSHQSNGTGLLLTRTLRSAGGVQWADHEDIMLKLLELGAAIGKVQFLLPIGSSGVTAYSMDTVVILVLDER